MKSYKFASIITIIASLFVGTLASNFKAQANSTSTSIFAPGWIQIGSDPTMARRGMAVAYDSDRKVIVMFGGFRWNDGNEIVDDETWEFDGEAWQQITTTHTPTARHWHSMTYDAKRKVVVLFGGTNEGQYPDETWEYNGTDWIQVSTAHSPGGRVGFGMVFDTCREKIVVYGGGEYPKGTWEYDGIDWVDAAPADNPGSRYMVSMAFDSARCRTALFGGDIGGATGDNQTWEYDGVNWTQITTTISPPARWGGAMAYDLNRETIVLFGGYGPAWPSGTDLGDTWEYDGINWIETTPAISPSPREQHIIAFEGHSNKMLLFGGFGSGETWLYGTIGRLYLPMVGK